MKCVAVIDTMFSRVDMGRIAKDVLERELPGYKIKRITVPGIKDLPGAARRAWDSGCTAAITLGWVGKREADRISYLAMSTGLIVLQVITGMTVIDVTVHEDEAERADDLKRIALERARDHAHNLAMMLRNPEALTKRAGQGVRQGYPDVGPI